MPNLPVSIENDITVQNNTTGQVDYLQFQGNMLTHSAMFDYGITGMNIVSSDENGPTGPFTLVAQDPTTGNVDFLGLNISGHLISSAMSNVPLPHIVGSGIFGTPVAGQVGQELVSQLADGSLDILAFNAAGTLLASDLVAGSAGLPHAVGVAVANAGLPAFPAFAGVGSGTSFDVITQLADGSLDAIGFSGNFGPKTLAVSGSFLLPGSAGSAPVGVVNPDNFNFNQNITDGAAGHQDVQMVSQLASGQLDMLNFDSGYNDGANQGVLYASNLLNTSFPGFHVVDGGLMNNILFPIT
jgi:hypothetical protein